VQDPAFSHSSTSSSSSSEVASQVKVEVAIDRRDSAVAERRPERSSPLQVAMPPIEDESRQMIFDDGARPLSGHQGELNFRTV